MKRILLIIGLVVITVCVLILGFNVGRSQDRLASPKDTIKAEPAPTSRYTQPDNVSFSFVTPLVLPSTLPVYGYSTVSRAEAENTADSAAKTLGFTSTPSAVVRGDSYSKTWSDTGGSSLIFAVSGDNTSFLYRQARTQIALKNNNPGLVARQFVSLFNELSVGVKIANMSNGPFDGIIMLESPPAAPLRGYSLEYLLDDYPVAAEEMNISAASVILDANNTIRSANVTPALEITQQAGSVSVLTSDQILTSLTEKRGAILDSNKVGSPELGSAPVFSTFRIQNAEIFYAPRRDLLLPALLISGLGTTSTGETQTATLFLWAFPAGL